MSPVWCSTSFEYIDYTGSITQIHSIPMSPVWCSTSFEDIEYTGSITRIHSSLVFYLCLRHCSFGDIEYTGSITQIHSIPISPVWCSASFEDID